MYKFSAKTVRFSEPVIELYVTNKEGVVNTMLLLQTHPDVKSFQIEKFGVLITDLYEEFGLGAVSKLDTTA